MRSPARCRAPAAPHPAKLLVTSAQSAEIIKHASNAFLALKISFINAVANLAEAVDADIEDIAAGMGLDSRIGPKFLRAGLGYGGSCFPKDVAAFHWVAQQQGVDFNCCRRSARSTKRRRISSSTRCSRAVDAARQAAGRPGPGLQGRYRRYSRVSRHRGDQETAGSRRFGYGLRSRGHGARQGPCCRLQRNCAMRRHLRSGQGRRRGADSDRLEGVCPSTWCGSTRRSLPHRD
jgi:hypothetical protein